MADTLSQKAAEFLSGCDLARGVTGSAPEPGTPCYLFAQDEAGRLNKKCEKCPYFEEMSKREGVSTREVPTGFVVEPKGILTEAHLPALKAALDLFPSKNKPQLLLDCSSLLSLPSQGLGMVLRAFKAARDRKQDFFLIGVRPAFRAALEETRLIKVMPQLDSVEEAEALLKKREEEIRTGEARAREEKKQKLIAEAKKARCWEFFNGNNPKNATPCEECHYKIRGPKQPCWIIRGDIDGVAFEYIDEVCTSCAYFMKFNPEGNLEIIW